MCNGNSNLALGHREILHWLRQDDPQTLETLWQWADAAREAHVGTMVHLRGLVEISNHCIRLCGYCGLRAPHTKLSRYRMSAGEILGAARQAVSLGYGTVVLQGGEDPLLTQNWVADVVRQIKTETPLAVTLSLGERTAGELHTWRQAGADRYLLRFETSDTQLFERIHPPRGPDRCDRIATLKVLKSLGYEVGSGIMVGLPGQTFASIAHDILLFRQLDLDMIGIGPFLPHPATPLGKGEWSAPAAIGEQAPRDELMVYKAVALTRIACPQANIPSTTALATINPHNGRELGLQRGANVVMPNLTPLAYRAMYEIYPGKACVSETGAVCHRCLNGRIQRIGRSPGIGPGGRRNRIAEGTKS